MSTVEDNMLAFNPNVSIFPFKKRSLKHCLSNQGQLILLGELERIIDFVRGIGKDN